VTTDTGQLDVLAAAEQRALALARADGDALRRLHHAALRWTTHRGRVLTRDEYIAGNTGGELRWLAQELSDVTVVVEGTTAVLTAVVTDHVQRDGDELTFRMPVTLTWVRSDDGSWSCIAGHAGPPLAGPA
jgi:Domain of unknown function (DUF4440)